MGLRAGPGGGGGVASLVLQVSLRLSKCKALEALGPRPDHRTVVESSKPQHGKS